MLYVNSDVEDLKSNILMRGNNKPRKSGFVVLNCFHLVNHFGKRVRAWFQVIRSIQRIWIVDSHKTSSKLVQLLLSFVKLTETCFASKINIFDFLLSWSVFHRNTFCVSMKCWSALTAVFHSKNENSLPSRRCSFFRFMSCYISASLDWS